MKDQCKTAVEGVLDRKLTDQEADLLEQHLLKQAENFLPKTSKHGRVCQMKNVQKLLQTGN